MATKAEVRQRVGEDLALVPIGQALEAQDQIRIDETYDEIYEILKDKGLAIWASSAEVPSRVVPYYVQLMLDKLALTYSVPEARYNRIKMDAGPDGENCYVKLAELVAVPYDPVERETDY